MPDNLQRPLSDNHRDLLRFLCGKTIAAMRFDESQAKGELGDIDLIFTDGSELELYGFETGIDWIQVTPEEAVANAAEIAAADDANRLRDAAA